MQQQQQQNLQQQQNIQQQQQPQQPSPIQQHSPQNLPPSPMSVHRSPNMNNYQKKNNLSPHISHSSPQNIQMTTSWPTNQYYYSQYPVPVPPYNVLPANRSPVIPPPAPRKVIAIINPLTGNALNTNPMSLTSSVPAPATTTITISKHEEKLDFKVPPPHVSKAVDIVDPAIRNREIREQKEREEAEQEAARKVEEEKKEAERKELERIENERLAEIVEKQRIETERRLQAEQEAIEKAEREAKKIEEEANKKLEEDALRKSEEESRKRVEEEARRKEEEETELKRVIEELEAKKRREEQDRIISAEVASQNVGRVPSPPIPVKSVMKIIDDPSTIQYPAGIQAPLAVPASSAGKLAYSIEFLLQFQQICLDTEEDLSAIVKELNDVSRGNNPGMRQPSDRGRGTRLPGGAPGVPINNNPNMGDPMFRMGSRDGRMEMGKFNMGRPLTGRGGSNNNHMERQGSRGGGISNRGGGRGGGGSGMKITRNPPQSQGAPTIPFEQVVPLEKSENRWVPTVQSSTTTAAAAANTTEDELLPREIIIRKVNALLNKLTVEKFDSIAAQIFVYAKQSAREDDGKSIRTVIKLTFEKACDEPAFATMWAQLCRSMYDAMTDDIRDTSIFNEAGEPSSGVLLFRKYLFNRCQVEFEKGWKVNMPEVTEVDGQMTEEYYIAAKAKRQGLGLIQFIGELFKLDMLSERIMYNCMIRLCNDPTNAGDEEAESLCKLLTTIGKVLDHKPKTSRWVDIFITRMKTEMVLSPKISSRIKFMIQNLLDLRKDKWVPRIGGGQVGPTTIAKIHEMAEKAKEEKEAASMKRNNSSRGQYIPNNNNNNNNQYNNNNNNMARTGSYRGGRDQHHFQPHNNNNGGDGWSTVSPVGNGTNKSRTNDLTNFGKTDRSRAKTNILGPGNSPFASLSRGKPTINTDNKGGLGEGRSSPATNMFSALEKADERKKLQIAPRTIEAEVVETPKLSDDVIKRKCKNILEEYFNVRDKKELSECVKELEDAHYIVLFIGEMLAVVEKKAEDVERMTQVMEFLELEKELYVKAFKSFMEGYDDLTIDVPQAPKYVAQLLSAAALAPEEVDDEGFDSLKNAYKKLGVNSK
ncbi:armadillo-type protein [Helicostylum pulchrum]|nr:armadillo-type protein [Helicostylum pulchrum]